MIEFPPRTLADWRALVEKELAGKPFDKALVHKTAEGLSIAPLYTEAEAEAAAAREAAPNPFRICMRLSSGEGSEAIAAEIEDGADALWLPLDEASSAMLARGELGKAFVVFDGGQDAPPSTMERLLGASEAKGARFAVGLDPLGQLAERRAAEATLDKALAGLAHAARIVDERSPEAVTAMVSTLPYHDAGADAADELAIALSTGARYLEALLDAGLGARQAARQIALRICVGNDTFLELCKVRALRTCWRKVLAASGAVDAPRTLVHAVCAARTLSVRDPWVNMLRVTTQVFAAILGGADLVTPNAFDQALGEPSALGRRVARNTGLVLREESHLGRITDPGGGSYYFETLTDALAREAWRRFRALEADGGIAAALTSGRLAAKLSASWHERLARIATRKLPILGVSEFANLDEKLPGRRPREPQVTRASGGGLAMHRDAAAFEELRARAEAMSPPLSALLVTLGPPSEFRARTGFAAGFFAAGGVRTHESANAERARVACLCGSDERYAAEGVALARALKAAGCERVLLAGRPGALESALREAGVDGFIFVGCDAIATLSDLLGATP